jgi:two-component system KDP operon response regulator KdpE
MSDKQRILIVDDERQITRVLSRGLTTKGYDVHVAADGEAALQTFADWHPDLVITDLSMPNMNGLELCRRLRAFSEVPIIVLSVKGEERAKVEALDAGADDYVTKPFGIDELLARIRATLRRAPVTQDDAKNILEAGDFRMQLDERKLTISSREIHLTPKEYDLMAYLVRHSGKVLTHHMLLGAVWGGDYTEQTEYLRVFIGQLRKKIESDPANPKYILTEPWIGYRFQPSKQ